MNRLITFWAALLVSFFSKAQEIEMADNFRGEGKIYVVVAVILIILFGIFFYLLRVEKKVNRLEKELKEKEKNEN